MKNLTIIGLVLLALSVLLFYLTASNFTVNDLGMPHIMGILGGIGIGLIIGGMVGYVSKGSAIKADQKKKEFKQLQKDKEDLEKQAAEIARREAELRAQQNNNPQV
jgi:membrane-bound ClpP family serine protease